MSHCSTVIRALALSQLIAGCATEGEPVGGRPGPDRELDAARGRRPYPDDTPDLLSPQLVRGKEITVALLGPRSQTTRMRLFASHKPPLIDTCTQILDFCTELDDPFLLATGQTSPDGTTSATFTVPADLDAGSYLLQAALWNEKLRLWQPSAIVHRDATVPAEQSAFRFTDVSAEVRTPYTDGNSHTGGIAWIDYNNDYFPDLFLTNGSGLDHTLLRNDGDGTFTDVSYLVAKPDLPLESAGVKQGDIDNDGDTDLFVTVDSPAHVDTYRYNHEFGGPNFLYVNQGDGTFEEDGLARGVVDPRNRRNIDGALADYDNDGFLDLYQAVWAMNDEEEHDEFDRMLRNDGTGHFVDVTAQTGLNDFGLDGLTCLFADFDLDGWQDLYLGNTSQIRDGQYFQPYAAMFWMNQANGRFLDSVPKPNDGLADPAAMGADVGDVDNDGDWEMAVTDYWAISDREGGMGGGFFVGQADGTFSDNACFEYGTCVGGPAWPVNFGDFDRDGWIDLLVGIQWPDMRDQLFRNLGGTRFENHEIDAFDDNATLGGAMADYDGDGDLDYALFLYQDESELYRNDALDTNHWMELKLVGTASNRDAIGALVRVSMGGTPLMRRVSGGDSAHSHSELIVHFGLRDQTSAPVEITWPSGLVQNVGVLPADELHFVREGTGVLSEGLNLAKAEWSVGEAKLRVRVASTFGGRTALDVAGLGPLRWSASDQFFAAIYRPPTPPASVDIRSRRGGRWTVPVVVVP